MNQIISNNMKLKQLNVELIKSALIELGQATKLTIAHTTGLSVATCGNILNELLEKGEALEIDAKHLNGGRPAKCFAYNTNYSYVACLYINKEADIHRAWYVVSNLVGEIIEEDAVSLDQLDYSSIENLIERLTKKYDIINAIGIGMETVIRDGVIVGNCDNSELINFPLEKRLEQKFSMKVTVENDMNLIALGFYRKQNYEEAKNIAVMIFPENKCAGSGLIVDGHIVKGNTNFAGEISYLPFCMIGEDKIIRSDNQEELLSLVEKSVVSMISVLNPETIVLSGDALNSKMEEAVFCRCAASIPKEHLPRIIVKEDLYDDYINGLIWVTLQSLTCDLQLVKKRI